ncbi:MAG: 2-oxo acid dehydrogenase subunit E2 [Dehalococcoidia bacterium]|nr:2-oxo acid dehydrogenase subunit E2 [Dehalococcoidia bacterium]
MAGRFKRIKPTSFMAMAAQMWPKPDQPIMYGSVEIEMTKALDYIARYSQKHGVHVTVTHLVIAVVARYLKKYPEANVKCEAGKFYQRQDVDIFVLVSVPGKKEDLGGVMLRNCDEMSLADIANRLRSKSTEVKQGKDDTYGKSRSIFAKYPPWVTKIVVKFADFYLNRMNRDLSGQGMPQDPFGSAMVTSVGMFGVEEGYGPIIPLSRLPIFVVVTEVRDRPWVEDGKVVVRPIMKIMVTLDHRVMDGYKGGQLSAELKRMEDPEKVFGLAETIPVKMGAEAETPVEPVSGTKTEDY